MEIMWFFLGCLTIAFALAVYNWKNKKEISLSWLAWSGIIISAGILFFALAWSISSLAEGEPQAAGMGMLIFGGLSIIIFLFTRKKIINEISAADK